MENGKNDMLKIVFSTCLRHCKCLCSSPFSLGPLHMAKKMSHQLRHLNAFDWLILPQTFPLCLGNLTRFRVYHRICKTCKLHDIISQNVSLYYLIPMIFHLTRCCCKVRSGGKIKNWHFPPVPQLGQEVKWIWTLSHLSKPCRYFPYCPIPTCSLVSSDRRRFDPPPCL